jgi:exopolysaccharide biosynthesis polyprenyl glycosylphosphotransferase
MSRKIQPLSITLFLTDLIFIPIGFWSAIQLRSVLPFGRGGALAESLVAVPAFVYLIAIFCWTLGLATSGAYNPQLSLRWFNEAWRVVWGAGLATILMAGLLYLVYRELSRLQFVYFFSVTLSLLLGYRAAMRVAYRLRGVSRPGGRSRVVVVGAGELGGRVAGLLLNHSRWGYEPLGFLDDDQSKQGVQIHGLPVLGPIDLLGEIAEQKHVDEVWVALPLRAHDRLMDVVAALERRPIRIKVVPDYFSMALVRAYAEIVGGLPVIGLRDPLIEGVPRLVKRIFDLLVTSLTLIPVLPLMGGIALLIRLDSKGPVLLQQERVGENGRIFPMLKFRTMVASSEKAGGPDHPTTEDGHIVHKHRDDPRVTRIGRLLRRYSLDELPQLLNVFKGEMSLVGPRPEMPWLVDRYEPWQRKRFAVPQGLTGWWQIHGRSNKPMHLNTEDDLYYVYNYSIWLDLWILLNTPIAVLRGQGAF